LKESSYFRLRTRTAAISGTVCQAPTDDVLNHLVRAILVVNAQPNPVAVAEIKLCQIAMQMLLRAMLIDALHAALENAVEALNRVRNSDVRRLARILKLTMVDSLMVFLLATNFPVTVGFVRHQVAFPADIFPQDRRAIGNGRAVNVEATGRTAALNQRKHNALMRAAGLLLGHAR
jgi:hypothetical protein